MQARLKKARLTKTTSLADKLHDITAIAHQRRVLADRRRLADQITLHRVATLLCQEAELLLGFHALSDDRHLQAVTEIDDSADDRRRLGVAAEIDDEGAVYLDLVEGKRLQVAQRGIAAAEIVHR